MPVFVPPVGLGFLGEAERFVAGHLARAGDAVELQPAEHGVEALLVHAVAGDRDVDFPLGGFDGDHGGKMPAAGVTRNAAFRMRVGTLPLRSII